MQLGRLVDAIVKSLLVDSVHVPLGWNTISSKLTNKAEALSEVGVLAEPNGRDDEDLLREYKTIRRVVSVRHNILSKTASFRQKLSDQEEKQALKHQKRVLFALRTMVLLQRVDKSNLRQTFSMTTVCNLIKTRFRLPVAVHV